jgi:hypothetical protein
VLTFSCAKTISALRPIARIGAAAAISVMTLAVTHAAQATTISTGGCIGGWTTYSCVTRYGEAGDPFVRTVPPPRDDAERTHAAERERRWLNRCHPAITQDRYGVARYHYSSPGCEFGVGEY